MVKDNLIEVLHEMEEVTKLFKLEPFDIIILLIAISSFESMYAFIYSNSGDKFPRIKAFLWTLDSRNIKGKKFNRKLLKQILVVILPYIIIGTSFCKRKK